MINIIKEKDDIIYFAGYTDGDGCFSITPYFKKFNSSFVITSTNFKIINYLISTYGGYMRTNKNENRKNNKPCFYFIKERKKAVEFITQLIPYLLEKQKQACLYISFFETLCRKTRLKIINDLKEEKQKINLVTLSDYNILKKITKHIEPTREYFMYLAGFIDAKCHLGIQHYKPKNRPNTVYKIVIQCNNTKSPIFYWLKKRFGGSCHFIDRKTKDSSRSNQILWKLTGKSVSDLLQNIVFFLRYKKPVAKKIIEFYETTMPNGGDRHSEAFHKAYKKISTIRESIVSDVHNLNRKRL